MLCSNSTIFSNLNIGGDMVWRIHFYISSEKKKEILLVFLFLLYLILFVLKDSKKFTIHDLVLEMLYSVLIQNGHFEVAFISIIKRLLTTD